SLITLPTELRREILTYLFRTTHALPLPIKSPTPLPCVILNLLHINALLRHDTASLLPTWSPIWFIPTPTYFTANDLTKCLPSITIDGIRRTPKLESICPDIFAESDKHRIPWCCYCVGEENWTYPELISAWASSVPCLPDGVKDGIGLKGVYLDITPTPRSLRTQHRITFYPFLHDKRTHKFLEHADDIIALVRQVQAHYNARIPVHLTGSISAKSGSVNYILRSLEYTYNFVGTYLDPKIGRFAKLSTAVSRIINPQVAAQFLARGTPHPLASLRDVKWSRKTTWQYAIVADMEWEERAMWDSRVLAQFAGKKEEVLEMKRVGRERRKLQHCVAMDLGLETEGVGEGDERRVIVRK
ncbi:hypothetical protein EK21DRAFT_17539, partial [Setomelanomma holmii]